MHPEGGRLNMRQVRVQCARGLETAVISAISIDSAPPSYHYHMTPFLEATLETAISNFRFITDREDT